MRNILKYLYSRHDEGIYSKISICGIKIVTKPKRLRLLNYMENKLNKLVDREVYNIKKYIDREVESIKNYIEDFRNNIECKIESVNSNFNSLNKNIDSLNYKINSLYQKSYSHILEIKKNKLRERKKLKVAFIVIWSSQFTMNRLYEMMLESEYFDPYIICLKSNVNNKYYDELYKKSLEYLNIKYKNVKNSYENGFYIDFSDDMDIIFYPMIHDYLLPKFYSPPYLYSKDVIMYYSYYGYNVSISSSNEYPYGIGRGQYFFLMYKVFMDTKYIYEEYLNSSAFKNKNIILTGYPKFDNIKDTKLLKNKNRKFVILAPHQDVDNACFCSSFLKYFDIYLKLPYLYPDIDFVFRPHPLLKVTLLSHWSKDEIDEYYKKMDSYDNCYLDESGDYYDIFINSDGMIHDCGSFLIEYLMLNKPVLYMLKNKTEHLRFFNKIGVDCIEHCYIALNEEDILTFMDNIILNDNDIMKEEREEFINMYLKVNHLKVNEFILEDMKKDLDIL